MECHELRTKFRRSRGRAALATLAGGVVMEASAVASVEEAVDSEQVPAKRDASTRPRGTEAAMGAVHAWLAELN